MADEFSPAIAALERRLGDMERSANEIRRAINLLCKEAGLPPRHPEDDGGSGQRLTQIKPDTFYGKKPQTAVREYLEMRRAQGEGPAKPREIFEALKLGGYRFETKNDDNSITVLRDMLRKRSHVFHQLPNGSYGMLSWYENVKVKATAGADDDTDDDEGDSAPEPPAATEPEPPKEEAPKRGRIIVTRKAETEAAEPKKASAA